MNRTQVINEIIKKSSAKRYLEIGVSDGSNFVNVQCEYKVGVDPEPNSPATYTLTSDEFFEKNTENFDVIFVDGLHHSDQVIRDIENSLNVLNPNGFIICHDMNPEKEEHQTIPFINGTWNGDCWRALVHFRKTRKYLNIFTVDTDYGCSIITRGNQKLLDTDLELTYDNFDKNRNEWLNLISVQNFYNWLTGVDVNSLLNAYVLSPNDPENNYLLAKYYHNIGQTASAVSYYIRTAERTEDHLLQYECLIQCARCFESQGTRKFTVKGFLQHAVALMPKRPEAYFYLSLFYESQHNNDGRWFDSYTTASIGTEVCEFENLEPLRSSVEFPGKYAVLFQKAHTAWWCGLQEESKNIFLDLYANYDMNEQFTNLTYNNLVYLNAFVTKKIENYSEKNHKNLRIKFKNSEKIEKNYSESYQDMFVLAANNGKNFGKYVEIGAGNAHYGNNTYLLEKNFGWTGVSFDIQEDFVSAYNNERSNPCIHADATQVDYKKIFKDQKFNNTIDYLQIDCDPPEISYKALLQIPFDEYKFSVITFEHDAYANRQSNIRDLSREYLKSKGYVLVVDNIAPDNYRAYEDWYIHPDLVDESIIEHLKVVNGKTKKAENYMLGYDE
jgi:SAM-dependent methyltransferase